MKISNGFILRTIKGANGEEKNVVITVGEASKKLNGMITLNETCAFLWKILEKGATRDEIVEAFCTEYNADIKEISSDVDEIIQSFKEIGCIDD